MAWQFRALFCGAHCDIPSQKPFQIIVIAAFPAPNGNHLRREML